MSAAQLRHTADALMREADAERSASSMNTDGSITAEDG